MGAIDGGSFRLPEEVRNPIRARHYSIRTGDACLGWIQGFIPVHGKRRPVRKGQPDERSGLIMPRGNPPDRSCRAPGEISAPVFPATWMAAGRLRSP